MKYRPDLLDENSPKGIEVIQLTTEEDVPNSHIYMEAQIFTPDSKRLVLQRSGHAHGSDKNDPEHQFLLCDIESNCALHPLTEECGAIAPSLSPDGQYLYYLVDETEISGGRLTLKRVSVDGTNRQTVMVIDTPLPGTKFRPGKMYPLSTISSDGKRLAAEAFLGDGKAENGPWGLLVFDLEKATVNLPIYGPSWINMHLQYCRSTDSEASHDIMIQENHGCMCDTQGVMTKCFGEGGADIHVIRDDGTDFRNMPWGRDGNELCQGHQCWRGRTEWAITSTITLQPEESQLIEGRAGPHTGHVGLDTPEAVRNDLSQEFPNPHFYHFATDIEGRRLITDEGGRPYYGANLFLVELAEPGGGPAKSFTYLLNPQSSGGVDGSAHMHPFLSPDGSTGFFNSDESGILQAYMIRGLENL